MGFKSTGTGTTINVGGAGSTPTSFPKCIDSITLTEDSQNVDGSLMQNEDGSLIVLLEDGTSVPYDDTVHFQLGNPPSLFPKCIDKITLTDGSQDIDGSLIQNEDGTLVVLLEDGTTVPYDNTTHFLVADPSVNFPKCLDKITLTQDSQDVDGSLMQNEDGTLFVLFEDGTSVPYDNTIHFLVGEPSSSFPKCIAPFTLSSGTSDIDGSILQNEDGSLVVQLEDGSTRPYNAATDFPLGAPPSGIEASLTNGCPVYETVDGKPVFVGQTFVRETINEDGTGLSTEFLFKPKDSGLFVPFDGSQGTENHGDEADNWEQLTVYCTDISKLNQKWEAGFWGTVGDESQNVPEGSSANLFNLRYGPDGANGLPTTDALDAHYGSANYYDVSNTPALKDEYKGLGRLDDTKLAVLSGVPGMLANHIPAAWYGGMIYLEETTKIAVSWRNWDAGRVYADCKTGTNFKPLIEWNDESIPLGDNFNVGQHVIELPAGLYNFKVYTADDQTSTNGDLGIYVDEATEPLPFENYGCNYEDIVCDEPTCVFICKLDSRVRLGSIDGPEITLGEMVDGVMYTKEPSVCELEAITPQSDLVSESQVLTTENGVDYTGVSNIAYITVLSGPLAGTTITGGGPVPAGSEYVIGYK